MREVVAVLPPFPSVEAVAQEEVALHQLVYVTKA